MTLSHRVAALLLVPAFLFAGPVERKEQLSGARLVLGLSNASVAYSVVIDSGKMISDRLETAPKGEVALQTDADFSAEIMWTDWQAPKKINNAENPVTLRKEDFRFDRHEFVDREGGATELFLYFHGKEIPLLLRLRCRLDSAAFYARRSVAVADTSEAGHFLQAIAPRDGILAGKPAVVKEGGFGQPVAFTLGAGGGFFGIEYPAAENSLQIGARGAMVKCGHEMGMKIGRNWLESEWAVEAVTPTRYVKRWFMAYVDDIRVAPLRPYTLYNSWYDLRSVEYPRVPAGNFMEEANVFHMIDLIRKNMIEKHDIRLDAFVLDDGWDVYESDWMLRDKQFPRGLKPIADELRKTNTSLGIWFGPTGGYSFRMRRVNWMREHGYEVVGHTPNTAMLCLAGTNYGDLFKRRVTDFAGKDGVGYFKWDGIQFSCSEPGHGHPVGIYSRRAVMESVIDKCRAVREANPNMFLNVTSGTWLSPWWVKYANTIWMQGSDYGYADVPSISPRDAAITYRDFILYDDFTNQKMWFPIANLMTHGIIKGNLQWLGGKEEPLDKFTNETLLYFARGVAMWELYISPDILTDGEWNAMGEAMHWARDRFPLLTTTEMVGGDPTKGQTYGYTHFKGSRGIIAARNPLIASGALKLELSPEQGLDPQASSLVLEKVYPHRWISPKLFKAGATVELPLDGYETAVYELYPLSEAREPLLAGAPFDVVQSDGQTSTLRLLDPSARATLLNPGLSQTALPIEKPSRQPDPVAGLSFRPSPKKVDLSLSLDETVREGILSILLTPSKESAGMKLPYVVMTSGGRVDTAKFEKGESSSTWYTLRLPPGAVRSVITVSSRDTAKSWSGKGAFWLVCQQETKGREITLTARSPARVRPMPPRAFPAGVVAKNIRLGELPLLTSGD